MKPYFDTLEKIERLQYHAGLWLGTPFMPNAALLQHGVSCQKLVGRIYIEAGFLPRDFIIPEGPMDWSAAHRDSLLEKFMSARPEFLSVAADVSPLKPIAGDMIGIQIGGCVHHFGVVITEDGRFVHCLRSRGVILGNVRDASYFQRIKKIWRPIIPDNK